MRKGLAGLGEFLILGIVKKQPVYLVNFGEIEDSAGGCEIFFNRLLADAEGNYMLVPPQWRYDGRGLKLGHAGSGIEKLTGCVYDEGSAVCAKCLKKNLESTGYDGKATLEFDLGIRKVLESIKYLGRSRPDLKAYLDKILEDKKKVSGLLINEKA